MSYLSPKTVVKASPIEGRGLFASAPIAAGEIVAVKGGSFRRGRSLRDRAPREFKPKAPMEECVLSGLAL